MVIIMMVRHYPKPWLLCILTVERSLREVLVDRGYVGHGIKGKTKILLPGSGIGAERGQKSKRSAVEAVISHLKHGHGLSRNYLKGLIGDAMNSLLSGMGWNVKLLMSEL